MKSEIVRSEEGDCIGDRSRKVLLTLGILFILVADKLTKYTQKRLKALFYLMSDTSYGTRESLETGRVA